MCGSVTIGRDMFGMFEELMSCYVVRKSQYTLPVYQKIDEYLLQQICGKHQDFSFCSKALGCPKIANSFLQILGRGHYFQYMKRRPRHVVAEHL